MQASPKDPNLRFVTEQRQNITHAAGLRQLHSTGDTERVFRQAVFQQAGNVLSRVRTVFAAQRGFHADFRSFRKKPRRQTGGSTELLAEHHPAAEGFDPGAAAAAGFREGSFPVPA